MKAFEKLGEVLRLVKQTGDKVIIMDSEMDPFVIMDLDGYRSLLREEINVANISEEELLDKINRQISAWKASRPDLSDYDLSQFRVDSLRNKVSQVKPMEIIEDRAEMSVQPALPEQSMHEIQASDVGLADEGPENEPLYDYRRADKDELLERVMEQAASEDDEQYYPEPEV